MGITTVKLVSQKLLIKKSSMNWFKPVYTELSDITDPQRRHGHIKLSFYFILCKLTLINIWENTPKYISLKPYIRVGTDIDV